MSEAVFQQEIPRGSRVAVVGGGVAGIVSSYLISQNHQVTLYEAADYLGGHTSTVVLADGPDAGRGIDTGFIVLNDKTYPNLHRFLSRLNVPVRYADMSFSYYCEETELTYGSRTLKHLFCQHRNLVRPLFYQMLLGIVKFWSRGQAALRQGGLDRMTLGDFLREHRIPEVTVRHYILPMAGAIWSSPAEEMADASAETILNFCKNHGLLGLRDLPRWQTVVGASHAYLHAFKRIFTGEILLNSPIKEIRRSDSGVEITTASGDARPFDYVVVATHADQVLPMLVSPTSQEERLFGVWRYKPNLTVLHTDISHLPPLHSAWASWNYRREKGRKDLGGVPITYNMNMLQGLESRETYCVTLNPEREIQHKKIIRSFNYTHPVFSTAALESQKELNLHQGSNRTFFAGSYHGFGFHEDAVRSAVRIGGLFSGTL